MCVLWGAGAAMAQRPKESFLHLTCRTNSCCHNDLTGRMPTIGTCRGIRRNTLAPYDAELPGTTFLDNLKLSFRSKWIG